MTAQKPPSVVIAGWVAGEGWPLACGVLTVWLTDTFWQALAVFLSVAAFTFLTDVVAPVYVSHHRRAALTTTDEETTCG